MRCLKIFFAVACLALSTGLAVAQKRVALVFSAENYDFLRPLDNPGNDAEAIEKALENLDFEVVSERDRDLRRMRRALDDFRQDAAGADVALVFFAGHGVEIAGENLLLPTDADPSSLASLRETSLPLEDVRAAAAAVARSVLIVLDACRNDPFNIEGGSDDAGRGATSLAKPSDEVRQQARAGLGRVGRAENTLFAFSAAPGETAADGTEENSPFSAALARYLGTDGLEIRSVLTLVQQQVYDQSAGRQLPYVESGLPELFFASTVGQLPEREALLLAMANVTTDMRAEVEATANANGMPLAPLYGTLISADLEALSPDERRQRLSEAALAFVKTRGEMKLLASSDPQVAALRKEAADHLALGAFEQARARLDEAAAIDAGSSGDLAGKLVSRRASEAATHRARGGLALAQLDYPSAIAAYEHAAELHQSIENEGVPDAERRIRDWLLADLGDLYKRAGSTADALAAFKRMEAAARKRVEDTPNPWDARRDLAESLMRIGDIQRLQGEPEAAAKSYEQALAIARAVRDAFPNAPLAVESLAIAIERMGDVRMASGDFTRAAIFYGDVLEIHRRLADMQPGNRNAQFALSIMLMKVADVRVQLQEIPAALEALSESSAILRSMAQGDGAGKARLLNLLSAALSRIGDIHAARNETDKALPAYQECVAISERLLADDPGNFELQRNVALTLDRVGDIYRDRNEPADALLRYQPGLAIRETLIRRDPANIESRRDFTLSLLRMGDVRVLERNFPEASRFYRQALEILVELNARDPKSVQPRRDLAIAHYKLSLAKDDPKGNLAAALAIAEAMQADGVLPKVDADMAQKFRDALMRLE